MTLRLETKQKRVRYLLDSIFLLFIFVINRKSNDLIDFSRMNSYQS